jgi:signal transduction histidine kinase
MSMLDDFVRMRLYRERASEFDLLAETEVSPDVRLRFRTVARHYRDLVEQAISCLFVFNRYSLGTHAVRTFSVIVSTIVLSAVLSESVRVYANLVRTNQMLRRERENKLTNLAAVVAAITHEVRQPLTGISTKSAAARRYLGQEPPNIDRAQALLGDLTNASLRIDEVLKSVGALFRSTSSEQEPIDVNELSLEAI